MKQREALAWAPMMAGGGTWPHQGLSPPWLGEGRRGGAVAWEHQGAGFKCVSVQGGPTRPKYKPVFTTGNLGVPTGQQRLEGRSSLYGAPRVCRLQPGPGATEPQTPVSPALCLVTDPCWHSLPCHVAAERGAALG